MGIRADPYFDPHLVLKETKVEPDVPDRYRPKEGSHERTGAGQKRAVAGEASI